MKKKTKEKAGKYGVLAAVNGGFLDGRGNFTVSGWTKVSAGLDLLSTLLARLVPFRWFS